MISTSTNLAANYIGGEWRRGASSTPAEITNPATAEVARQPAACRAATTSPPRSRPRPPRFRHWRRTPPQERIQYLFKFKQLLQEHADEIARMTTMENGKTLAEARAELQRGIENVEVACGIPTMMQGYNLEDVASGIDEIMIRQPLGVTVGDHAVQLPGDDPAVVPAVRDRLRQHVHPQAVRARAAHRAQALRAAGRNGLAERRHQPGGRRQAGGRRAAAPPGRPRHQLRRLEPGRALHLLGRARRTASACSARAARRTTSSSCPTPISR